MELCPHCMNPVPAGQALCPNCGCGLQYANGENQLPIGTVLTGSGGLRSYQIGAARGQGGFGITYIALEQTGQKRVAVKEYFPTRCAFRGGDQAEVLSATGQGEAFQDGLANFLDEAKMLAAHDDLPSVVRVIDYFRANNTAYLVMEYLDGVPLHEQMNKAGGRLSAGELIPQLPPLLRDLGRLHQSGVIHRDISPDNIMCMPDGTLKLLDFGCARSMEGGKSMTVLLKQGFAPIEQYRTRGQGPYTDVYALAATIYYCITGQAPPTATDRTENDTIQSPIALGADITVEQETALLWALSVQPGARPQTMEEFAGMLFKEEASPPSPQPSPSPSPSPQPSPSPPQPSLREKLKNLSKPVKIAGGCAALVIVGLAVVAAVWNRDSQARYEPPLPTATATASASPSPSSTAPIIDELVSPSLPPEPVTGEYNGYTYEVVDGTIEVNGFEGNGIVPLPEEIDGMPITSIASGAFAGIPMDSIDLPASLESIGANAFRGCSSLKQIFVHSAVSCDETSFSNCPALRYLQISGDHSVSGWQGLPDGCRIFREGADVGVGALSDREIVIGSSGELYGLTADGQAVLLDVPFGVTDLTILDQVSFSGTTAPVTWIEREALENASDEVRITLSADCYFPFEIVGQASWAADWQTFAFEWMLTCEAAQAINDARGADLPQIRPNEGAMRSAVLRLSELFTDYGSTRPDGSKAASALTEIGVDWQYANSIWGRNSKNVQDCYDVTISDAVEDLAQAIDSDTDYNGQYWTEIGAAISSPDGENFYRYIFGFIP